ncbi:MAG TPA: ArsC/Spx/MgsR family protein [Candidatus Limnocylindrales bacterium]
MPSGSPRGSSPGASGGTRKPAAAGVVVQVFGTGDSQSTRAAQRFFKERRIDVHLVDLRRKPLAAGELRRFVERLGAAAIADSDGRPWREAGLGYLRMTDAELADRLLADQRLLLLPLVRVGNGFAAGRDESAWKRLLSEAAEEG